jgi:acyl-CoA synthetase (NDP forming)
MRDLGRLLRPKSIAVIGGGVWCTSVIEQCQKMGFRGPVWPVHPSKTTIGGLPVISSLDTLPDVPDAVFIGVNRHATLEIVETLSRMGAGGAVCFASGFSEAQAETGDGINLQARLLQAAGEMPILGPNCYGFINYLDGALLWPDQHGGQRCDKGVALLTQSSNIAINLTMQARDLPLAYVVTAGNQAQTGLADIGQGLLADTRVTALGMHIEGIGDLHAFEALAKDARRLGKPIVALKAGKSDQAQAAAISHTASLAGSNTGARALLTRLGIAEVDSLPALLETLKLLHFAGPLPNNRIVSMSCSGGEASLMADAAHGSAVEFPTLDGTCEKSLREALGPKVALANPLDYHTYIWNDVEAMSATFNAILQADVAMGCVIIDFPREDRCDPAAWECAIIAGARASKSAGKPLALVATLPEAMPENVATRIIDAGLIPLMGLDDALTAIASAAFLGQERPLAVPILPPSNAPGNTILSEADAKTALSHYGVPVPRSARSKGLAPLRRAAENIGFPVVLKAEGLAHKTENGGVVVGLGNSDELLAAATQMCADTYLIEEMITEPVAELLIGVVCDPAHGFVLTLAAGGILTEILADSTSFLLPVSGEDIKKALGKLRIAPVLNGYRGKPGADISAIVKTVMAVQTYVTAHADRLKEVEINPLICTNHTAVAADALITIGDET